MFLDKVNNVIQDLLRQDDFSTVGAKKKGYRNAPRSLAGDAPVRTVLDQTVDAVLSPVRNPGDFLDGLQRLFTKSIFLHGNEPLFSGAKDDRVLAAPAVRVLVGNLAFFQQGALFAQFQVHRCIGIEHIESGKITDIFCEMASIINWRVNIQMVFKPGLIILAAVSWSSVDAAGSRIQCNVRGKDQE
jgi:hypothetical protein